MTRGGRTRLAQAELCQWDMASWQVKTLSPSRHQGHCQVGCLPARLPVPVGVLVTLMPATLCAHRDSMDSVKQSAALCLLRLYKASPDLVPMGEWTARVVHLLNDQHMVRPRPPPGGPCPDHCCPGRPCVLLTPPPQ